ncbi:MAG: hypothetical protein ACPIOQ_67245, partial [Promethearchaeia archaeon]
MRQRRAPLPPGTPVSSPTARRRTAWSSRGSAMRLPTSKVSGRRCAAELSSSTPDCQALISVPACTPSARCPVPLHARRYSTVTTAPSATPPAIFSRFQEAPSQEGVDGAATVRVCACEGGGGGGVCVCVCVCV